MAATAIEWATDVWNPTAGCDRVSPGCDHCYALTMAKRLKGMGQAKYQLDGDPRTSGPGFLAHEWSDALGWPLTVKKPMRVFVNSMSDLFHDRISDAYLVDVFGVMAASPQHTFQVLTKRHARMRALLSSDDFRRKVLAASFPETTGHFPAWPLPNVWLGVSVENQQWADIRIPALVDTPAAVRFLSCEPLLGPITLGRLLRGESETEAERRYPHHTTICDAGNGGCYHPPCRCACHRESAPRPAIDWVIVGGESGRGARPMDPAWARSVRDQCVAAGVSFLFKQWGNWCPYEPDDAPFWKGQDGRLIDGHYLPDNLSEGEPTRGWWAPDVASDAIYHRGPKSERLLDGRTWDEYPQVAS